MGASSQGMYLTSDDVVPPYRNLDSAANLRAPWRCKTFLGLLSLQAGTELISITLLLNKVIGIYGLLAILTGYSLSILQLSMYIYSLLAGLALAYLIGHIRKQSPLENLSLAWLYLADTIINTAYTTAFAVTWYLATFHDPNGPAGAESGTSGDGDAQDSGAVTTRAAAGSGTPDTPTSLVLIVVLTLVRIYFTFVVMSYARMVLQRFVDMSAGDVEEGNKSASSNPFAPGAALGQGFRGKLGRTLISIGKSYWLERKEDDEWAKSVQSKFRSSSRRSASAAAGPSSH